MEPYKLLIVDDFFVERECVKDIVEQSSLDVAIIGETSNGADALAFIRQVQPDFVLTDIEMPYMNGLQLAEHINRLYPSIHIIFFIFYHKFEYAKQAVQLGAASFIMKPIVEEDFLIELDRIIQLRRRQKESEAEEYRLKQLLAESLPLMATKWTKELFMGLHKAQDEQWLWDCVQYYRFRLQRGMYVVLAVEMNGLETCLSDMSIEQRELFKLRWEDWLAELLGSASFLWCETSEGQWAVLLSFNPEVESDQALEESYKTAEDIMVRFERENLSVSIGISEPIALLAEVDRKYEQAKRALRHKFHVGRGVMISASEVEETDALWEDDAGLLSVIRRDMQKLLFADDSPDVASYLENWFPANRILSQAAACNLCYAAALYGQQLISEWNEDLSSQFSASKLPWDKMLRFESLAEAKDWLIQYLLDARSFIQQRSVAQTVIIANKVKSLISERYAGTVTVKEISEELHYSPNYVNNVFKGETGETILEYLTRFRMEQAKRLLLETDRKIHDITLAVGYHHETYFRNVFRQYTGMTPKEYREKMGGSQNRGHIHAH
ncbi:helix-turn-helix domain-containing protein [Paenibacillus chungangensis]|uniref:Helix-turn-helix domain-containing protein n=1 Tax=Paenibacillus chungangensis TaxID=696535 RepID=A0ABW3HL98_9BACL